MEPAKEAETVYRKTAAPPPGGARCDAPSEKEPPVEPPLVWTQADTEGYDPEQTLAELLRFYLYGHRPSGVSPPNCRLTPALLHPHLDLSRIRYEYPLCVTEDASHQVAQPLTGIIDALVAAIADESDTGRRVTRHVYRLEAAIKSFVEKEPGARLSEYWDRAAACLVSSSALAPEKREQLRQDLAAARQVLQQDGEVIGCDVETPGRLFAAGMRLHWRERCAGWREDLESLIRQLQDILRADFNRSPDAASPNHLRASAATGADDMDFDAMSRLLTGSHLGDPMPAIRRERIREALSTLLCLQPLFAEDAAQRDGETALPFTMDTIFHEGTAAVDHCRARMRAMAHFFKAVRIARLEIGNRYREALHDPFFARFDATYLTEEEWSLCPPVLLRLTGDDLTGANTEALPGMLNAGLPIKVLIRLDDLCAGGNAGEASAIAGWPTRLASMVMALNHVYVFQAPASRPSLLQTGFAEGFRYPGPALFSIYTGQAARHTGVSAYLHAEAAAESRIFPVFTFNPGKGETLAERFHVLENTQHERDWPEEAMTYRTAEGREVTVTLAFTPADFLCCDHRLAAHFWCVPPAGWHENMRPLDEYMRMNPEEAATHVPYLTVIDHQGQWRRALMTREILTAVMRCRAFWRNLQESGGINNSFARMMLSEERQRLEADKKREVEAIEQQYRIKLDRNIGDLTREIVQRIAHRLMAPGTGDAVGSSIPCSQPAVPPPEEAAAEAEEGVETAMAEEDEGVAALDDPYIDTPLCTSCNECTNANDRMFAYDENKQARIKDPLAGTYRDLVAAAERCPVHIIHPGKPKNPDEPDLEEWIQRAAPFL